MVKEFKAPESMSCQNIVRRRRNNVSTVHYVRDSNAPIGYSSQMQVLYVHEAGHMVVGHRIGLFEQGVKFGALPPGEAAQAFYTRGEPFLNARRGLAGLLAHMELLPETIPAPLLKEYRKSIIFDGVHPALGLVSPEDREFMSGAKDDLAFARGYAADVLGSDLSKINEKLREFEADVRNIVAANSVLILRVAEDMETWVASDDPNKNAWLFYSASRMKDIAAVIDG